MIPDAAYGAIIAAVIAAVIAFSGFIISKEQKTSDFRQAWLDGLRAELVEFLVQINALYDSRELKFKDIDAKIEGLREPYAKLNSALFGISLRINPSEEKSKALINTIKVLSAAALSEEIVELENFRNQERAVLQAAQNLLKSEWKRVKKGEPIFRLAKVTALLILIIGCVTVLSIVNQQFHAFLEKILLSLSP